MALNQREVILYLNVSKGKLKNKEKNLEGDSYTGTLVGIRERESEYEGKKQFKIDVKMRDSESKELCVIQFTRDAWYSIGFFARIKKIDISKPFTIGVIASKENEKMSFAYLKQEGIVKVEADKTFPKPAKVTVSGNPVDDYTKVIEEIRVIIEFLNKKLNEGKPEIPAKEKIEATEIPDPTPDDLPF